MVNYSSPFTRQAASLVTWACALLFACFSFCYLYLYQSDYLAQLQYHFSHGETTYQPLVGAVLITLPLLLLGIFLQRTVHWPLRSVALSWFPSAFLLTVLTSMRMPELPDHATCMPWGALIFVLMVFALTACLCSLHPDATGERASLCSYLSSNMLIMCCLMFMCGVLGYSSLSGHRELRMGRMLHQGHYARAVHCVSDTIGITHRLFALRAAALAESGYLADSLFCYPVPQGTTCLMPEQSDSLFVYDALPQLYRGMRAVPRSVDTFTERVFLEHALRADSLPRPLALDYLLCSHLLRGDLRAFCHDLVQHTDSLPTSLPRHYREALVLCQSQGLLPRRPLVSAGGTSAGHGRAASPATPDPLTVATDSLMTEHLRQFTLLRSSVPQRGTAAADSLATYFSTYWAYYYSRFH